MQKKTLSKIIIWIFLWTAIWWAWIAAWKSKKGKKIITQIKNDIILWIKEMKSFFANLRKKKKNAEKTKNQN
jgi:hypothetical protein